MPLEVSRRWQDWRWFVWRGLARAAVIGVFLALAAMMGSSRLPLRGAALFGKLVQTIRNHQGAAAAIVLVAVAIAWLFIASIAAWEWKGEGRRGEF